MRTITAQQITDTVARLCIEANTRLPRDVQEALDKARAEEPWPLAKNTLDLLWSNLAAAREEDLPICQDTGMACVFLEIGQDVHLTGGDLRADEALSKHADWAEKIQARRTLTEENIDEILRQEVGAVFAQVLADAGVYKCTAEGRAAFLRFAKAAGAEMI